MEGTFKLKGLWEFECYDKYGFPKWKEVAENIVVAQGLNHILDTEFHNSTQVQTWYIGLKGNGAPNANDTLASHGTWTENVNYTTNNRQVFDEAAAASGSTTNTANKATFSITANAQTIAGGFLASVNNGSGGTLFSVVDFTGGVKTCDNGDTLQVTYTLSANTA